MRANTHSRVAQPLDDGFHHFALPVSIRIRLPGRQGKVRVLSASLTHILTEMYSWRWAYGIGTIYGVVVVILIMLFSKET